MKCLSSSSQPSHYPCHLIYFTSTLDIQVKNNDQSKKTPGFTLKIIFILVLTSFFLPACATMKKEECLTASWYDIGFEDGANGYKISQFSKHRKACSKYDVSPDLEVYLKGRDVGLIEYCTPYNGYHLGCKGRGLNDVCHGELNAGFLEAYNIGLDIYLFKNEIKKEKAELDYLIDQIEDLNAQVSLKEKELAKGCSDSKTCRKILNKIRKLDSEKADLELEIASAQSRVSDMQDTLAQMKNSHRF